MRTIQSGKVSQSQMKVAVGITAVLSLLTAIPLIIIGTSEMPASVLWVYVILAILALVFMVIQKTTIRKFYRYF